MSSEYNARGTLFTRWISNDLKPEELSRFKKSKAYKTFLKETYALMMSSDVNFKNKRMFKALS